MHAELIKRSTEVLKFLAAEDALDKSHLDIIWEASMVRSYHHFPFFIPSSHREIRTNMRRLNFLFGPRLINSPLFYLYKRFSIFLKR